MKKKFASIRTCLYGGNIDRECTDLIHEYGGLLLENNSYCSRLFCYYHGWSDSIVAGRV